MGKDRFFNKWFWEDWITTCRGMKLDPFLILLTKVPQNGLKVYVRPQSIKLPEGKHREKLLDIGFGKYLSEMTPKLQTKKMLARTNYTFGATFSFLKQGH